MAILAESVVDEWLNRQGFFTIRGVKHGVNEMDIVAVRRNQDGSVIGWHVEVQVSFRPVGYLTPPSNAKRRTPQELADCVQEWVRKKFLAGGKKELREHLWPGAKWAFHLVHGVVREPQELELIQTHGIELHPFNTVLEKLCCDDDRRFSGSAGGDLAEIVQYYENRSRPQG